MYVWSHIVLQIVGDGIAVETSDDVMYATLIHLFRSCTPSALCDHFLSCEWLSLLFKDTIAAPSFDWIVRWYDPKVNQDFHFNPDLLQCRCNRAALQPQWLLPCRAQALLEDAASSKISVK